MKYSGATPKSPEPMAYILFFRKVLEGCGFSVTTLIFLQVMGGVIPVIGLLINSKLIDQIVGSSHEASYLAPSFPEKVSVLVGFTVLFFFLEELFSLCHGFFSDYFKDLIYKRLKVNFVRKISSIPTILFFEDPLLNNQVTLANQSTLLTSEYINVSSHVLMGTFSVIPVIFLSFTIQWWIPVVIISTMIPLILVKAKTQRQSWDIRERHASTFKRLNIYEDVLISSRFAKEVRLYNLSTILVNKWLRCYMNFFHISNQLRLKGVWSVSLFTLLSCAGMVLCFWYVVQGTIAGDFTVGQLSFLFGVVVQLRSSLSGLIYNAADILKAFLSLSPLIKLMELKECSDTITPSDQVKQRDPSSLLRLEGVSFTYPGQKENALKGINLKIHKRERVAIIGENGSGKSTLVKLVCGLYTPLEGGIYWEGTPLSTLDINDYRIKIGTLLQDFSHFPFSVRENIDIRSNGLPLKEITDALKKVRLEGILTDTTQPLSSQLEEGRELSGGQWQRLALARVYATYKERELLIFDEPTSALDPCSEHEIISLIQEMMTKKTSIVISHRLALAKTCDRILVLSKGEIIEEGSHEQLMHKKGTYWAMFEKQASYYRE